MNTTLLLFAAVHGAGALLAGYVAASTISHRSSPFSPDLAVLGFALAWWSIFQGFELIAGTAEGSLFWSAVAYPGIQVSVLSLLSITTGLVYGPHRIPVWGWAVLAVIPLLTVSAAVTNPLYELMWANTSMSDMGLVIFDPGPWYMVHIGYMYILLTACAIALITAILYHKGDIRIQAAIITGAGVLPLSANLLYLTHITNTAAHDFTVIGLIITAFAAHKAFSTYGGGEIVPIARRWLVEHLRDPIAVTMPSGTIFDHNDSFTEIFLQQPNRTPMMQAILPNWEDLLHNLTEGHGTHTFQLQHQANAWMEASIALMPRRKHPVYAVVFRDISEHMLDQQQLRAAVGEREQTISEVRRLQAQLREQAIHDELTNLFNRRFWSEAIEREFALSQRSNYPISIAMLDIDLFKLLNDNYGHRVGDEILVQLANILRTTLRKSDLIFRFGGEEFVLLMPGISGPEAVTRLNRLRETVQQSPYYHREYGDLEVTVSIGIAETPTHSREPNEVLEMADMAMYQAKQSGRNRVILYAARV